MARPTKTGHKEKKVGKTLKKPWKFSKSKFKRTKRWKNTDVTCALRTEPNRRCLNVVPWMSKTEWDFVRDGLFSSDLEDQLAALSRIAAWKSRCYPRISLGIEVTASLVRAKIEDARSKTHSDAQLHYDDIVMMYSMALIRFVNLVIESGQTGMHAIPIQRVASQMGIPEWLVELRHEATHHTIPSLPTLRLGTALALVWIKQHYWKVEGHKMKDLTKQVEPDTLTPDTVTPDTVTADESESNTVPVISKMLHKYQWASRKLGNGGKPIRRKLLDGMQEYLDADRDLFIEKFVDQCLLIPTENCDLDTELDSEGIPRIAEKYVKRHAQLLELICSQDALPSLLKVIVCRATPTSDDVKLSAVAWCVLILRAVLQNGSETRTDIKTLIFLQSAKANDWKCVLRAVLERPNKYTPTILLLVLELVKSHVNHEQRSQLVLLVSIFCSEDVPDEGVTTTFPTLDYHKLEDFSHLVKRNVPQSSSPWQKCNEDGKWAQYPLGLLPSQTGAEVLNLDLPRSLDKLHCHEVEDWHCSLPSRGFQENPKELTDVPLMTKPNLRTRLLLVQHQKSQQLWSDGQLQEVMDAITFF